MKQHLLFTALFFLVLTSVSCGYYNQVNFTAEGVRVNPAQSVDTAVLNIISPYSNALSAEMNEVIGYCDTDMKRMKPESALGNFICDVLLKEGRETYNKQIDFAVYNYGGLRIDAIYQGKFTRGKIFELLPFENFGVVVTLSGYATSQLIQKIVDEGGWPVGGISFFMEGGKAHNIKINNTPFDSTQTYRVVMNDYMANGGDKMDFVVGSPQDFLGVTIRDLVLAYIEKETAKGNAISSKPDGRIKYAE